MYHIINISQKKILNFCFNNFFLISDTEDRECLLLDEYSGCPTDDIDQGISGSSGKRGLTLAEEEDIPSDLEASDAEISSGDDSTDIDAVVKEYRDRIQVHHQ